MLDTIIAGDGLDFDATVVDRDGVAYKASEGWSMSLRLIPRALGTVYTVSATASGDDFRCAVASATTATWAAGNYSSFALVTKSGERKTVYLGELCIQSDPGTATAYDVRSNAKKALDAANVALDAYMTSRGTVSEYEIAGRRMKFKSAADIVTLIHFYERKVADEERAQRISEGLGSGRKVFTRFTS